MVDPVFLVRLLAAALVAVALSLGAVNGWGEPSSPVRTASQVSSGR